MTAPCRGSVAGAYPGPAGRDKGAAAQRRELVAQLARRRAAAGLSQADVASLMRTSQSSVARLESGRHDAQLSTLARYAEALGLSLDEALGLSPDSARDAGGPAIGSGDAPQAEAGSGPPGGRGSPEQPQRTGRAVPEARPEGPAGRKPGDRVPAGAVHTPDGPDPDHVLTSRQREVLEVIRESMGERGYPPSLREIGGAIGLTSTSSVSHHLRALQRAGYLRRDSGRARTVEVRLPDRTAALRVRSGAGFGLRQNAVSVRADDRPGGQGWDLVTTRFTDMGELAQYAASFGEDVVVLGPPDLREAVIARLRVAEPGDGPAMPRPAAKPGEAVGGTAPVTAGAAGRADVQETAAAIAVALVAGRRVRLRHYNDGNDVVTERDVDPIGLLAQEGRAAPYLEGWCRLRNAVRTFRLDRVLELEVLDVPASPPPEAEPETINHVGYRPSKKDMRVELELSAPGGWVARHYPCESVSELGDGRLRVVLRTPDTGWVRRLALRLGEDGRVVSPPALVAEIRSASAAALANYEGRSHDAAPGPGDPGPRAGSAAPAGLAG